MYSDVLKDNHVSYITITTTTMTRKTLVYERSDVIKQIKV